ncbi:hypothetical protein [Clostridium thermarum]|uniref:hypothetical protein n=1 Tax=Clostridium thermarum TaxID=1716543 RepID=UPI0013D392AC|nr:hypothetical protein [Clostridium thermarum]
MDLSINSNTFTNIANDEMLLIEGGNFLRSALGTICGVSGAIGGAIIGGVFGYEHSKAGAEKVVGGVGGVVVGGAIGYAGGYTGGTMIYDTIAGWF